MRCTDQRFAPRGGIVPYWSKMPAAAVFLWMFLLGCTPLSTFDVWTHLRTGQLILERGSLPVTDWYTYTDWDRPWIELHWLFQLIVAGLYRLGGIDALILAKAGCLMVAVFIAWFASRDGLPGWAKAFCWILPVVCISERSMVKPEMLSLCFLSAWLWIAARGDDRPRMVWWLPIVQIIWTNCHGLFVLGLVVGAAWWCDVAVRSVARGRFGQEPPGRARLGILTVAGLTTAGASLLNPYVEEGALFPLVLFAELGDQNRDIAEEHASLVDYVEQAGFASPYLRAEAALWLITLVSFLWLAYERRFPLMRALLFAGFSYLAFRAVRNINTFALVSGFVLCANCGEALRRSRLRRHPTGDCVPVESQIMNRLCVAFVGLLMLSVITNAWAGVFGRFARFGLGEAKAEFIHGAAKFAGRPGMPGRAYVSHYGQAAVYIFHNAPERRVFMDGRLEVVTPETERRFHAIYRMMAARDRRWETLVRGGKGDLPVVILDTRRSRTAINGFLNTPGWRMVYADDAGAVFIASALAERLGLPVADVSPLMRRPPD